MLRRKVEGMHYDARKHLLEYDDVANDQRKVVYELRDELMGTEDVKERYESIRDDVIRDLFDEHISPKILEEDWDVDGLQSVLGSSYGTELGIQSMVDSGKEVDELLQTIQAEFANLHNTKEEKLGSEINENF